MAAFQNQEGKQTIQDAFLWCPKLGTFSTRMTINRYFQLQNVAKKTDGSIRCPSVFFAREDSRFGLFAFSILLGEFFGQPHGVFYLLMKGYQQTVFKLMRKCF